MSTADATGYEQAATKLQVLTPRITIAVVLQQLCCRWSLTRCLAAEGRHVVQALPILDAGVFPSRPRNQTGSRVAKARAEPLLNAQGSD